MRLLYQQVYLPVYQFLKYNNDKREGEREGGGEGEGEKGDLTCDGYTREAISLLHVK